MSIKELSQEDKKRIRKARKFVNNKKRDTEEFKEKNSAKLNHNSKEYQKLNSKKTDKILKNDKRVLVGKTGGKNCYLSDKNGIAADVLNGKETKYSKSTVFFNHLQDQVQQDIRVVASKHDKTAKSLSFIKGSSSSNVY